MFPTARAEAGSVTEAPLAWSRAFPATREQVREARQFLAGVLDGGPAAGDAVLCLSEIVTNAIMHSRSGEPGGHFAVTAAIRGDQLQVDVRDEGGPWTQPVRGRDGQHRARVTHRRPIGPRLGPHRRQRHRVDRLVHHEPQWLRHHQPTTH